jgi:hypothetical protein
VVKFLNNHSTGASCHWCINKPINNAAALITEYIATTLHQVQSVVMISLSVKKILMWFTLESQGSTTAMKELVKSVFNFYDSTVLCSGIYHRIVYWKVKDVSEEHVASIFTDKEYTKQELYLLPPSCWFLAWIILWRQRYSSETSVDFQQAIWCYMPEDRTPHNHRCEHLKFSDSMFS